MTAAVSATPRKLSNTSRAQSCFTPSPPRIIIKSMQGYPHVPSQSPTPDRRRDLPRPRRPFCARRRSSEPRADAGRLCADAAIRSSTSPNCCSGKYPPPNARVASARRRNEVRSASGSSISKSGDSTTNAVSASPSAAARASPCRSAPAWRWRAIPSRIGRWPAAWCWWPGRGTRSRRPAPA